MSAGPGARAAITPDPSFDIFEIAAAAATPSTLRGPRTTRLIKIFVDAAEK